MKELSIEFANGMTAVAWKENNETYIAIVNENDYVITDRKLTVSEADKLNKISGNP